MEWVPSYHLDMLYKLAMMGLLLFCNHLSSSQKGCSNSDTDFHAPKIPSASDSMEGRGNETKKCQGVYLSLDDRTRLTFLTYQAHGLFRPKGWWIRFADPPQQVS